MSFVSRKFGQFAYFASEIGDWRWEDKRILDFGGNAGNLLADADCSVSQARYWCIDVSPDASAEGRRRFPAAHWIHYDRYNFMFNSTGRKHKIIPATPEPFDLIIAYSVFTHTTQAEMLETVGELADRLAPGGVLAFSFIDPDYHRASQTDGLTNLNWRLTRLAEEIGPFDRSALVRAAENVSRCILINNEHLIADSDDLPEIPVDDQKTLHSFYRAGYLASLFPSAEVRPPANDEMQHCCILRR